MSIKSIRVHTNILNMTKAEKEEKQDHYRIRCRECGFARLRKTNER